MGVILSFYAQLTNMFFFKNPARVRAFVHLFPRIPFGC